MNAMVLGAGRGTRLAALDPDVPKILVDVGGEPLLARQLRYLAGEGVDRVVVNAHHLAAQVEAFATGRRGSPELEVVVEELLLGTAGGVRNSLPRLGRDAFVVLYGDVLVGAPLAPLLERHERLGAAATIAVYESRETEGKGIVEADVDGRVSAFVEKGDPARVPALINAGLYVVEPAFVAAHVALGAVSDFGHDVFPRALHAGARLGAHRLSQPVLDVGTPVALREARNRAP